MLEIWGRRNSLNVQKVMWTVGELGLDYIRHDVGGSFGGTDTAKYIAMNPNRRVPTVVDDGFILWESNACVRYLAEKYGAGTLWPSDLQSRALADQWMTWLNASLYPVMGIPFMALVRAPSGEQDLKAAAEGAAELGERYAILDQHLANHRFVAGAAFTMADIPLGCATWRYYNMKIERPSLPSVEAWHNRLLTRPAFQKHVAFPFGTNFDEWTELELAGAGQ